MSAPNNFITLTGMWASKDKNGNSMMIGKLNAVTKLYLFKNTHKKSENEPDYLLKIAKVEEEKPKQTEPSEEETPF